MAVASNLAAHQRAGLTAHDTAATLMLDQFFLVWGGILIGGCMMAAYRWWKETL